MVGEIANWNELPALYFSGNRDLPSLANRHQMSIS